MKRLVLLATLVACQRSHDDTVPVPAQPTVAAQPTERAGAAPTSAPAAPPVVAIGGAMPKPGDFAIKDFAFTSGEHLPELRIHYMTLGTPQRDAAGHVTNAVLIMHGTTGSGQQFASKQFADVLFRPGQPLDVTRYYVIIPDDIGHGRSTKPSDGLHARFPHYGYADMVEAEHRLVTEGLKVDHLRLVMGTSMGCMHSWMWAEKWPDAMDAVMALACLPVQIAGRNREWRRIVTESIKQDPEWHEGEYTKQPYGAMRVAYALMQVARSSPMADQKRLPSRDAVDKAVETSEPEFEAKFDANDTLYAVASSSDYDPSADLEKITAPLLLVNSTDDFINPPELGIAEREIKRVKQGKFVMIPATEATHGHGTHTWAVFWQKELKNLLDATGKK